MKRIYLQPSDELLEKISDNIAITGIPRHTLIVKALESYLNGGNSESLRSELDTLRSKNDTLVSEVEALKAQIERCNDTIVSYKDTIKQNEQQILFLQGTVSQLTQSLSQLALTGPQASAEVQAQTKKSWWHFW